MEMFYAYASEGDKVTAYITIYLIKEALSLFKEAADNENMQ